MRLILEISECYWTVILLKISENVHICVTCKE